jgi:hypothetical protein
VTNPYEVRPETGTVYSGDGDNSQLSAIEEVLYAKLHKEGYVREDRSLEHAVRGVEEVASEESGPVNRSRSAPGDSSGTS